MSSRAVTLRRRVATVCGGTLGLLVTLGVPAVAHPFGPPPTALVSASGNRVVVEWGAAPDDAMVVGMALGILEDSSLERYLEGPVQIAPPAAKEAELSASSELAAYLLERIAVTQDGRRCDGRVSPIEDFLTDGARVVHDCPDQVAVVDLRIAMLHDVHDAYRTFAVTEGRGRPAQSVFTVDAAEQRWDFSAAPTPPPDRPAASRPWVAPLVGSVLAGTAGAFWWRRRSGRAS